MLYNAMCVYHLTPEIRLPHSLIFLYSVGNELRPELYVTVDTNKIYC